VTVWIPIASAIADLAFFPLAAAIVAVGLSRWACEPRRKRWLVAAMLFSVVAKVLLALPGHNYDMESWRIVSNILGKGQSIYADSTGRYNYGPIWAWIVSGFGHLAPRAGSEIFHLWIAAFLATVDVTIAWLIARTYSFAAALVFLLCPIGFMISGFHSQFDNLAVLTGLLAWLPIRAGKPRMRAVLLSAALLGVSLSIKHLLILFPLWLLFWKPLGRLRSRVFYAVIAYAMFFGSFLPWWNDGVSRAAIRQHVFGYNSSYGISWLGYMAALLAPIPSWDAFLHWIPTVKGFEALWIASMAAAGAILARRGRSELYLLYLLLLYASSPAVASQYVAIPVLAAAVYYSTAESWAFFAAGTVADFVTATGVGGLLLRMALFYWTVPPFTIAGQEYLPMDVLEHKIYPFFIFSSQFCAGVLVFRLWRWGGKPPIEKASMVKAWRAAGLVALGGLPIVLVVLKHFVSGS
jgi:hypothetical protein